MLKANKNKFRGKTIFIIGNGQSIKDCNMQLLKDKNTFWAYIADKKWVWNPNFSEKPQPEPCETMLYVNVKGDLSRCPRIHMYEKFGNILVDDFETIMTGSAVKKFKESFSARKFNNPVCDICLNNLETTVPINQGF